MNKEIKEALHIVKENLLYKIDTDSYNKLKYCPYGACDVWQAGPIAYLKSYNTLVAFFDEESRQFYINGLHSMTTRKHITYFLREYANINSFVPYKPYIGKALVNCFTDEVEEIK